jgi:hypothetical protein
LNVDPSFEDHYASFQRLFVDMTRCVLNNKQLISFYEEINDMYFLRKVDKEDESYVFPWTTQIKKVLDANAKYKDFDDQIFDNLKNDIQESREFVTNFSETQEIYDFTQEWNAKMKNSLSKLC